tara:strand:+ start:23 stop:838 length:816 start_codon:yes stop_codon:yes gene_type:complete
MTVTVLHKDVVGSTFLSAQFETKRNRATRKLIVKFSHADGETEEDLDTLITELTTFSGTDSPLGPKFNAGVDGEQDVIVHPSNNNLALQTVEVAKIGPERFLVTAQFFVIEGNAGFDTAINVMSMRVSSEAKRVYPDVPLTCEGGRSLIQYSLTTHVPCIKIRLPFYLKSNPIDDVLGYVGGLNCIPTAYGGVTFGSGTLRFDGAYMDEMGGLVSEGGSVFRYKGYYEFTARNDGFIEDHYICDDKGFVVGMQHSPTINDGACHASTDFPQ